MTGLGCELDPGYAAPERFRRDDPGSIRENDICRAGAIGLAATHAAGHLFPPAALVWHRLAARGRGRQGCGELRAVPKKLRFLVPSFLVL